MIHEALQKIYDAKKSVEASKGISPCIKNIMMKLQTGEEVREELAIEETARRQLLRELRFDEAFESIGALRKFLDSAERSLKNFREVLERSYGDPVTYSAVQPHVKMTAHGLQRKLRVLKRARGL